MTLRSSRARAYAPDPDAPGRACDVPGCTAPAEYRAPLSRGRLHEWRWFCLAHVRAYNAAWDYYRGMSPEQIEAEIRFDVSWQRPTWPLGRLGKGGWQSADWLRDPLAQLDGRNGAKPPPDRTPPDLRPHLAVLDLTWPVTLDEVKIRYKELAKRHHPDANGGDHSSEERLKTINLAYAALKARLHARPTLFRD